MAGHRGRLIVIDVLSTARILSDDASTTPGPEPLVNGGVPVR